MVFPLAPTYANAISVRLPELESFWNESDVYNPVYSGIRFGSDGKIYRSTEQGNWQATGASWLITGAASSYYLVRTVTSGSALGTDGGTLQQMNANRDYQISSSLERKTTDIEFSISDDSLGSNILVTRTYQLDCERIYDPDQGDQTYQPGWTRSAR
jgi:hypothetical protein